MPDLIEVLKNEGREFGFFQAITLLEHYFRARDHDPSPLRSGRMRFESDPSMTFPPGDIAAVTVCDGSVRFFLSFLGLTGVSSPLPNYFTDYIARYPDSARALSDFCALFNQRIYALFYQAFRKYRLYLVASDPKPRAWLQGLAAAGDGRVAERLLAYTGVLSTRRRSARGLETIVSDMFGAIPVSVIQWVGRWAPLPNPSRLGSNCTLGGTAILGTHIFDRAGKFRISLGPLDRDKFETFIEGSDNIALLRAVVSAYVADPLEFDVEVRLARSHLEPVILGNAAARLGQTAALGGGGAAFCEEGAMVLSGMAA